jgi:hypothetical protein
VLYFYNTDRIFDAALISATNSVWWRFDTAVAWVFTHAYSSTSNGDIKHRSESCLRTCLCVFLPLRGVQHVSSRPCNRPSMMRSQGNVKCATSVRPSVRSDTYQQRRLDCKKIFNWKILLTCIDTFQFMLSRTAVASTWRVCDRTTIRDTREDPRAFFWAYLERNSVRIGAGSKVVYLRETFCVQFTVPAYGFWRNWSETNTPKWLHYAYTS